MSDKRPSPPVLTSEQIEQLRVWHVNERTIFGKFGGGTEERPWPWDCNAASEGQSCCIDDLLDAQKGSQ